jgi:hypothetical protein
MAILLRPARLQAARFFCTVRNRRHVLVCELDVESAAPNAVVVPIPAAPGENPIEKIDPKEFPLAWDGRRRFFDELFFHFIEPPIARAGGGQAFLTTGSGVKIEPWRAFQGITVPSDAAEILDSAQNIAGLEPTLRPPPEILELLARRYPGFPIALCRLPAGVAQALVAVSFAPRDESRIFYSLLQVTDGKTAEPMAVYKHNLFGQGVVLDERRFSFMQPAKTAGPGPLAASPDWPFPSFVEAWAPVDLAFRRGSQPNEDLWAFPAPVGFESHM